MQIKRSRRLSLVLCHAYHITQKLISLLSYSPIHLGFADKASDYALHLISGIQGMYLLTHTFKDPKLASRQSKMLQEWLEKIFASAKTKTTETA